MKLFKKLKFGSRLGSRHDTDSSVRKDMEMSKPTLTDQDMPALEELGEDSDYQQFLSEDVSDSLRTQALRKLFRLAKYNVTDGLDDYTEDYHRFESLGEIITADIRYQLQRKQGDITEKVLTQNEISEEETEESVEQQT